MIAVPIPTVPIPTVSHSAGSDPTGSDSIALATPGLTDGGPSTGEQAPPRLSRRALVVIGGRQLLVAIRFLIMATLVLGVIYPLAVWGVGRLAARSQADGSLVTDRAGVVVGSELIGQQFTDPKWFSPRPSVAGDGYDAQSSGGSNLSADSAALADTIGKRRADIAAREQVAPDQVPPDALTASASGLDPDISPAYARLQAARVATARKLPPASVLALVTAHTDKPWAGFLGQDRVNVLELNLALAGVPGQ